LFLRNYSSGSLGIGLYGANDLSLAKEQEWLDTPTFTRLKTVDQLRKYQIVIAPAAYIAPQGAKYAILEERKQVLICQIACLLPVAIRRIIR